MSFFTDLILFTGVAAAGVVGVGMLANEMHATTGSDRAEHHDQLGKSGGTDRVGVGKTDDGKEKFVSLAASNLIGELAGYESGIRKGRYDRRKIEIAIPAQFGHNVFVFLGQIIKLIENCDKDPTCNVAKDSTIQGYMDAIRGLFKTAAKGSKGQPGKMTFPPPGYS